MSVELDGLNLLELLDLLEPVPEPAPIPLTPQTPGWIVLGVVLAGVLWLAVRHLIRRHRATAYRRAAMAELPACKDDPAQIALVLRRTALAGFPRDQVAGLFGADWLAFLDRSFPGTGFATGPGQALATAPYQNDPSQHAAGDPALTDLARRWIRTHSNTTVDR